MKEYRQKEAELDCIFFGDWYKDKERRYRQLSTVNPSGVHETKVSFSVLCTETLELNHNYISLFRSAKDFLN